jgi:Xaa-Pro aminopeptidase
MNSYFDTAFFINNRQKLRELFTGTAPIVITANGLMQRSADTTFHFRQDSSFWYLTGINDPDIVLVMDRNKEYLIVPSRGLSRTMFDGAIDTTHLTERSGIADVLDEKMGWKQLQSRLKKVKHVATLSASSPYIKSHGFYTNPARKRLIKQIRQVNADIELLDLRQQLMRMRLIKQEPELRAMQAAIDLTAKVFKKVPGMLAKATHEYEIEAEITKQFRVQGANHAYQPIIAGGGNACTLHYIANDQSLEEGSLLLIDAGAEIENYAADITRTFAAGPLTKRQQQVMEAVIEVQDYALSLLKPGITIREYEPKIELFIGEKLRSLGLIKLIEHSEVRHYYPHATSHFLGLDVHDVGDYERPLEAGMVLTVEPGIYIPEEKIGIRIEDNVLITAKGNKVLSGKLPRILS